ncbi:MAG: thermonuclease family protein [Rhodoblastus sp.]
MACLIFPVAAHSEGCASATGETTHIAAIDEGFDLLLADGRIAVLSGLAAEPGAQGYQTFADRLGGAEVRVSALQPKPDRWGRVAAAVYPSGGGESLAEQALSAGLGRYRPDAAAKPCRDRLLAAERAARDKRHGLWGEPRLAALDAADTKAILAAPKGLVVVEGRVMTVGEQRGRLYLNFGPRRTSDFTLVISKRNLALFDQAGIPLRQLAGRRLRARGLVDRGFGPLMEIAGPDALELLDGPTEAAEVKR